VDDRVYLKENAADLLEENLKQVQFTPADKAFFKAYSLDYLADTSTAYHDTLRVLHCEKDNSNNEVSVNGQEIRAQQLPLSQQGSSQPQQQVIQSQQQVSQPPSQPTASADTSQNEIEGSPVVEITPNFSALKVVELKEICRERGLFVSGTKKQLIDRITEDVEREAAEATAETTKTQTVVEEPATAAVITNPEKTRPDEYLKSLVRDFILSSGGTARARPLGRHLAKCPSSTGEHRSANQELKSIYGSLAQFVDGYKEEFARSRIATSDQKEPFSYDISLTPSAKSRVEGRQHQRFPERQLELVDLG